MRNILALFLILTVSLSAFAQAPEDCAIDGKDWDQLLQEFVAAWQTGHEFCEFKRFNSLNTMISSDMRTNAAQYEKRIKALEAFHDESEPVNYLLSAFQETWFNLFLDASLDREYGKASAYWMATGISAGGIAAAALVLPYTKTFSAKTTRFLRDFIMNYFRKRAVVFGSTSVGQGVSRLSLGRHPEITTGFVRPPLVDITGQASDPRTREVFVTEFWEQMRAAVAGVGGGWFGGHAVSWAVKLGIPKWASLFTRAKWSRGRVADFASPGMIAGTVVTFYLTDRISKGMANADFQKRVQTAKANLTALAQKVKAGAAAKNEYDVWLDSEQLKNGLMLQNYLLTRGFSQSLGETAESSIGTSLAALAICGVDRDKMLAAKKIAFQKSVAALVAEEEINLLAALDITQSVQEILIGPKDSPVDAMIEPLIEANNKLLVRDDWILKPGPLSEEWWTDVTDAVKDVKVGCVPLTSGPYP